ncbi:hypothetical protein M422DRAFT_186299 [Sphaerobolus stellatus SS14]|uniref:CxC2-like cysteine cluster KDZ transposase-associated domain-containing protein n=1 Tax=Sphaerobolus stellatus (strain SS14) TaxID=990650 RepID=A0A0C9TMK9_SPHS4|nr:hypothetical protein M422DRAFT_186299 [Sphaerobolus stellatus SS14]
MVHEKAEYRCRDCFGCSMRCRICMVEGHALMPLHRIERWNGQYFDSTSLRELGLRVSLGHSGALCPNPQKHISKFCVMDTTGFHFLLKVGWYPMTVHRPRSAVTFTLLRHFDLLRMQAKVSAFDFYNTLVRTTNNSHPNPVKNRYMAFSRCAREWTHLKMLKRAGCGHAQGSTRETQAGELALLCPACPQPDWNLPSDWKEKPKQWLYTAQVAMDANFKLKRKMVSSLTADAGLGAGWAYVVEPVAYHRHLRSMEYPKETSACNGQRAVEEQDTRDARGLDTTGVAGCVCPRHGFIRPKGIGDLQRGERFKNMDYVLFSSLSNTKASNVDVSYDISCVWIKNLKSRIEKLPEPLRESAQSYTIRPLIPKFHLAAHVISCQSPFSWHLLPGCAEADGEEIERVWSVHNDVGRCTKEMAPGHRWDILDAFFGDWNWRKYLRIRKCMILHGNECTKLSIFSCILT